MMGLKEALARCDAVVAAGRRGSPALSAEEQEALSVVLTAARESYASRVVAETHALVERAREMERPHPFIPAIMLGLVIGNCRICGAMESAPIHQQAKETA